MREYFNYKNVKPVRYNGISYRSTLEARWSVLFDVLGLKFRYEPEEYRTKYYQPDFYIRNLGKGYFVEVKPEGGITYSALEKIEELYGGHGRPVIFLAGPPSYKYYPCYSIVNYCKHCLLIDEDPGTCFICGQKMSRGSRWHQVSLSIIEGSKNLQIGARVTSTNSKIPELIISVDKNSFTEDYRKAVEVANNFKF